MARRNACQREQRRARRVAADGRVAALRDLLRQCGHIGGDLRDQQRHLRGTCQRAAEVGVATLRGSVEEGEGGGVEFGMSRGPRHDT